MNPEIAQFEPHIMGILGGGLQFLRQFSRFPEWGYQLVATGLALFGYWLFNVLNRGDVKVSLIYALVGISANLLTIWGGTFGASKLSNAVSAAGYAAPVTNSK